MGRYIIKRLLSLIPVLLGITLVAFFAIRLVPGDVATAILRDQSNPELDAVIRAGLGLDQPVHIQLVDWITRVVRLDFGRSFVTGRPVLPDVVARLPATLELALAATLVSILIAVPLGILTAIKRGTVWDYVERFLSVAGLSTPSFLLALLLVLVVALKWRLFPTVGHVPFGEDPAGNLRHMVLPALSLGIGMAAAVARYTRSCMLDVLDEDYIRTARGKGLTEGLVVLRHALRNALIPVITVIGMQMGTLIGGTVIIESIFAWPGVGRYVLQGIYDRDYPIVQTTVMVIAFFFVLINLLVDVLYAYLDPKIRFD